MLVIHWRSRCRAGPQPQTRLSLSSKTYLHSYRLHNGDSWPRRLNRQATKFSLGPLMRSTTVRLSIAGALSRSRRASGLLNRSEEHTSELPSLMRNSYAGFCLKKKIKEITQTTDTNTHIHYTK